MVTSEGLWFLIGVVIFLAFVFVAFILWTAPDSVKNFLNVIRIAWRKLKSEDYTEQELWQNIMHSRSRNDVKSEEFWKEILHHKYPKDQNHG